MTPPDPSPRPGAGRSRSPRQAFFTRPGWRRLTILALYGYQGLAAGFAVTALPNHLAAAGAAPESIGAMLALIGLPWVLQPLWGPLVDRFSDFRMGRRRAWVLLGLLGALACLAALPFAGDGAGALHGIGLILLLHNACASLVDTAADAMIIDCVPANRLGETTALTRTGFVGGSALGAAAFSAFAANHGLPLAEQLLLLLGVLVAAIPLLVREEESDAVLSLRRRGKRERGTASYFAVLKELADFGRRRDILALLAVCVVEEFATAAFGVHFGLDLVATGRWDATSLSQLQGGLTLASGTVGALSIGLWLDRVGPRHALSVLLGTCVAAYVATAFLLLGPRSYALEACAMALSSVVPALVFVSLAPAVMQIIRGSGAATQFALVMAALNGGGVLGSAASSHIGALLPSWLVALFGAGLFALCTLAAAKPERLFGGGTQPRTSNE